MINAQLPRKSLSEAHLSLASSLIVAVELDVRQQAQYALLNREPMPRQLRRLSRDTLTLREGPPPVRALHLHFYFHCLLPSPRVEEDPLGAPLRRNTQTLRRVRTAK
jgi:hypothetical protein